MHEIYLWIDIPLSGSVKLKTFGFLVLIILHFLKNHRELIKTKYGNTSSFLKSKKNLFDRTF